MTAFDKYHRVSAPIQASFEFFPPKTPKMEETLWSSIERLAPLNPEFVSVTYGAGGSTRERTHATVKRIIDETDLEPAAHLTCVAATKEEINEVIQDYWDIGVRHIVALRGDPVDGIGSVYKAHPGGYESTADLILGIKDIGDFEISVSCYPEMHPETPNERVDIDFLKQKIDAGATRAISQMFFEPEYFLRYLERVRAAGIQIPIIPGIMPVTNFGGIRKIAEGCGATVPQWLADRFEGLDDDEGTRRLLGATVASDLCTTLFDEGIKDFHFYTLNRASLTYAICHILGLKPQV